MHKVLVFSDLHIKTQGEIIGLNPMDRFTAARDAALRAHPDATLAVLLGDLTHSGLTDEYEALKALLAPFPCPVIPMMGNHDNRAAFQATFPDAPRDDSGFVQQVIDLPRHRLITLDSLDEPRQQDREHAGYLCPDRLAFLRDALSGAEDRQCLLFVHHPPFDVGFPSMDAIKLTNGDDLVALVTPQKHLHLFCGHVHRTISGTCRGVAFSVFKSPCHQMPLDLTSKDSTASTDEPGAYGLLLLGPEGVVVLSEDVGLNARVVFGRDALPKPENFSHQ